MKYRIESNGYSSGIITVSKKACACGIIFYVVTLIIAFAIGYAVHYSNDSNEGSQEKLKPMSISQRKLFYKKIANTMKAKHLRENLRYFAKKPHVASFNRTREIVENIYKRFKSYGFIPEYHEYETMLSFPDFDEENYLKVLDSNETEVFQTNAMETVYEPSENDLTVIPPFYAYGRNGHIQGDLVNANYGHLLDFEYLIEKGVKLNNTIAIACYGVKVGLHEIIYNAHRYGVKALLIYYDPMYYSPSTKFPKGRWLSDDGVLRYSISFISFPPGDPLTTGYPAKPWAYKQNISEFKNFPPIPLKPISNAVANTLLNMLYQRDVPSSWKYNNTGPLQNNLTVELKVNNKLEMKKIRNVCGTIKGQVDPDRYVLLGNHIDAWVFGAVDASSGTSVMMEIARVLGEQLRKGWKPRRSIKLCGWNGEEFNLIGSVEYVEEFFSELRDQAVAYINIDSAVAGNYSLLTAASPLLHEMMFEVHQSVEDPYIENMSVFDKNKLAYPDEKYPDKHKINNIAGGSDFYAFYFFEGVPSIDIMYQQQDLNKRFNTSYYPMHHSLHDTVYWMENFVDKDYKIHLTVAKVGIQYLLHLADLPLIPFDGIRYAEGLNRSISKFKEMFKGTKVEGIESEAFARSAKRFLSKMHELRTCMKDADIKNEKQVRIFNDKMMQLEKKFIYPKGLPHSPEMKHYVMCDSGSSSTEYPFAQISSLLMNLNSTYFSKKLRRQISITTSLIESAARVPCLEN